MEEKIILDFNKVTKSLKLSNDNINLRKKNLYDFIKNGFPNKRKEDWKFSDLNQIIDLNIKELSFYNNTLSPDNSNEFSYVKNFKHNKLIFINGLISKIELDYEEQDKIEIIKNFNLNEKKMSQMY